MSTNFYVRGHRHDDWDGEHQFHIGKRSAAGWYCWDCGITLCPGGEARIHQGDPTPWPDKCPKCGTVAKRGSIHSGSVARELGFDKSVPHAKTGVEGCSSFTWGVSQKRYAAIMEGDPAQCPKCDQYLPEPDKIIEDEYGHLFTADEFRAVLTECPIVFHQLEREFS